MRALLKGKEAMLKAAKRNATILEENLSQINAEESVSVRSGKGRKEKTESSKEKQKGKREDKKGKKARRDERGRR